MIKDTQNKIDRRDFFKTMGALGLSSVLASANLKADPNDPNVPAKAQEAQFPQVPRRKLGKTGVEVPCLSFGGMFDLMNSQVVLRRTLQWGINYWDTASAYAGGNSELGIGKFLKANPRKRKDLFIVTKASYAKSVKEVDNLLQDSLRKMNTSYIDLFYGIHGMGYPSQLKLTDELKQWAEDTKKKKLIRFFGFSTHRNMAEQLMSASTLDWIDVIMTSYNFRLMQDPQLQKAVDACHKAGIGLIAMKVQAKGPTAKWAGQSVGIETEKDKKLVDHFRQKGFTEGQAKIKAVLEDERFSSACVTMENITVLTSNVAAALDKTKLTQADRKVFEEYAAATCSGYCAACADICNSALPDMPYTSDIMRYLMYHNSYGRQERARELFAKIHGDVRSRLLSTDYSLAEALCPQHMPISKLMAEAVRRLA
jgi:predicted aldo/keto reductase-like oxidoreductase